MSANDPAYPHLSQSASSYEAVQHSGLTKRELIAAMVMQGFAADTATASGSIPTLAEYAVIWSDALLAELEITS